MTANANQRLWRDLKLLRIAGALPVAAIPPAIALMLTTIVIFGGKDGSESNFADLPLIYGLAFILAIISGGIHLGLARVRGFATRRQCLVWGVLTSLLLEAGFFAIVLGPPSAFWVPGLQTAGILSGLVFFPAGSLSGWVYWRLGIRPAPRSDMSSQSPAPAQAPSSLDGVEAGERLYGGIVLAAMSTGAPMVASVMQAGGTQLSRSLVMVGLGAIGIWLIGGTAYVWLRRGNGRLLECLALGLLLGMLQPVASIAVSALIGRAMSADATSVAATFEGVGIAALARMGVIELPFGLLGGWLFWRMARPRSTEIATVTPLQRPWRDLSKRRLVGGLIVAGAPWTLSNFAYVLVEMSAADLALLLPGMLIFTEFWFVALGLTFFFAISRRRGNVARSDCFLLGALLSCAYPVYAVGFALVFDVVPAGSPLDLRLVQGALTLILLGLALTPLGLLSGWLLWRVGVRPARPSDVAIAPVFD